MTCYALVRVAPGPYGWAILDALGRPLLVEGSFAWGLTRWEARQVMGWFGLGYQT